MMNVGSKTKGNEGRLFKPLKSDGGVESRLN
jgi:hypothetical protein